MWLVFLSVWTNAVGQSRDILFSNLTTRDGLPTNFISSVAQDSRDFMWIGTSNGLCRYDGYHFRVFKRGESESTIIDNEVSALLVDGDFLWVGTWRGLSRINTLTFEIERINFAGKNAIRALHKDKSGNIWIGTSNGLLRYRNEDRSLVIYTNEQNGLSHNMVRCIFDDAAGNLWIGTYDKLNKLRPGQSQMEIVDLKGAYKPALKNNLIVDIKPVIGSDSMIWVGTETGLYKLNIASHRYAHFNNHNSALSNEVIKHIYSDPEGNVWLGTDFGLSILNISTGQVRSHFHNPQIAHSLANNVIWQIFEDKGGVIWFATSNGLSRINKYRSYYQYQEILHEINGQTIGNQLKSIITSSDGMLWMATLHGVVKLDPRTGSKHVFDIDSPPDERLLLNNVSTLFEDDIGRIWIGTAGGINLWDPDAKKMHAITANANNGLTSNYISKFTKSADGSYWVTAWEGGMFRVVKGFDDPAQMHFEFIGDFASPLHTYALNALWAVHNNELHRIDVQTYETKSITAFSEGAQGKDIYALHYMPGESIWAGTTNGLIEYRVQSDSAIFHPIITGNDFELNNLISDRNNNIWSATNNKVIKFNASTKQVEIFPLNRDLPLKSFSSNCVTLDESGRIIFGGDNGFIILDPSARPNHYRPQVFITSLALNNKPVLPFQHVGEKVILTKDISFTDRIELAYAQRSIAFEFASLHYWQPENNVYAFKLDGFDEDWSYVSGVKNFAVYSNLAPGSYTLRVKGSNNFGVWTDEESQLTIVVKPPLFLSKPFLAGYAVLAAVLVFLGIRIYIIRLHYRTQLKVARLEREHAEEIIQTKQQFFTNISHELRTPLSLIIPPIQQIAKNDNLDAESRSLIDIAEKNSQRLLRLINQILDFRKLEHENKTLTISWFDLVAFSRELYALFADKAARKEIQFTFHTDLDQVMLWADKEKVEIILFNLLSNAFKFTPKGGNISVWIGVDQERFSHGAVVMSVSDTGIGIAREEQSRIFEQFYQSRDAKRFEDGSGIGLTLVSEYTRLHKGDIKVESVKGSGTRFSVLLPLGDSHFPVKDVAPEKEIAIVATQSAEKEYRYDLRATKPLILLAEDNGDMVTFIKVSLQAKFTFVVAENGEEALAKVHSMVPDLIISDIMMPGMDGLTFCRHIKKDNKTSHIPIILLTARSLTSQVIEGIKVGADIYMTKPFDVALLEAHIEHLLDRQRELAGYFKHELMTEPLSSSHKENEDDRFLKKVMNTIEANIANPDFGVEMLSDELGMSSTHLYRKLKSLTRISASEIIKRYRLKKASLLLINKEGNISEIMYDVGFSNLSYFIKCFKSEFGVTPKEFQLRESKTTFTIEDRLP
jgi:signal transduction histidine kinase/ligand-binding sensor domain-containing protein/DNA-binding response OmpR family regulator